eukprot:GHVU01022786.1.p1 GENE.GHVU01022786.1~~GHVU01022786.1.p1  ORF type:complete len:558 (-),score=42.42 GHVU01022786.1:106-1779(-)
MARSAVWMYLPTPIFPSPTINADFVAAEEVLRPIAQIVQTERKTQGGRFIDVGSPINCGVSPKICSASKFLPEGIYNVTNKWRSRGARSFMEARMDAYRNSEGKLEKSKFYDKARDIVFTTVAREFGGEKVKPLSLLEAIRRIPQNTSPGFPYNKCGIRTKKEATPVCWKRLQEKVLPQLRRRGGFDVPCVAGCRRQIVARETNKPRLTWNYPMDVTVIEARFLEALMDVLKPCKLFAWRWNWLDGFSKYLYTNMSKSEGAKICVDFSHFDADPCPELIRDAFAILEHNLELGWEEKNQWECVIDYFINTPILFYDRLIIKNRGVPSGSYFTQLIDSVINLLYMTTIWLEYLDSAWGIPVMGYTVIEDVFAMIIVLGDDSIISCFYGMKSGEEYRLQEIATKIFGAVINIEKSEIWIRKPGLPELEDAEGRYKLWSFSFLGKILESENEIEVDSHLVAAQLIYPEEEDKDPGDVLTRAIGVAWMAGTSIYNHLLCRAVFTYIKTIYPRAIPTPWKRDFQSLFRYTYFQNVPTLEMPEFSEIERRYTTRTKDNLVGLW